MDFQDLTIQQRATGILDLSTLAFDLGVYFNPIGNFSLLPSPNGWFAHFRIFQYRIDNYGRYLEPSIMKLKRRDGHLFASLDADFNLMRKYDNDVSTYYKHPQFNNETPYLEDGRMVEWNGQRYISSATFYQQNNHYQKFGMEIQKILQDGQTVDANHFYNSLESGIEGRQKNWMAIEDRPLLFVIGTSSTGVELLDIGENKRYTIGHYDESDLFRGNSNLIRFEDGYLAITHRRLSNDFGREYYANYFIRYDKALNVKKVSRPVKFSSYPIEFITDLKQVDDCFQIGVTVMDDTPQIMRFKQTTILDMIV